MTRQRQRSHELAAQEAETEDESLARFGQLVVRERRELDAQLAEVLGEIHEALEAIQAVMTEEYEEECDAAAAEHDE